MIRNLFIRNFKNIRRLDLDGLERVNLFTGRNNTGKSTLLEAVALYVNNGDLRTISQLLDDRGEILKKRLNDRIESYEKQNLEALSSLFTDRKISFTKDDNITIGKIEPTLPGETPSLESELRLRIVRYLDERIETQTGDFTRKRTIIEEDFDDSEINIGIEIRKGNKQTLIPINRDKLYRYSASRLWTSNQEIPFQYIKSINTDSEYNGKLWDNITLTEKELYVVDALRIVEPRIERIAFIGEHPQERSAVVKVKTYKRVIPIRSMGEGINRILSIILSLVNSDNGFLLIDEFENGLHYSVQEDLWRIVFKLSFELNIQIFATTHSNDCINGFEEVLNSVEGTNLNGKLFRLEKKGNEIID